ncbi:MAG TPA: NAD-binding protein, partial [Chloroflexota bacterium]|nr:NAD-binding protein [Chloroflexota bacterium]
DRLPVLVKLSADEYLPRGLKPEQSAAIARALAQAGCAGIEVIGGAVATDAMLRLSSGVGEATLADLAGAIRSAVHPLGLPVIAAGRILSLETGERVLRDEQADLVATGRALLADPALVAKARSGIEVEAIPCIGCMACYTPAPDGGIGCPVNGEAGHEHLPPLELAPRPRRLTILGASLAGLELARVAATRGHEVELASAGLPLGGLLGLRAGVPGNAEFGRAFLYFGDRLVELGVSMVETPELGAEVTVDCRPQPELRPAWARGRGVLFAADVLGRDLHEMYGIGRRVAVAGPGALAAEVALFLAGWGRRPTVIVPGPPEAPFPDVHPMHGARLQERLEGYKIPLVTDTTPVAWQYDENRKSQLLVRQGGRGAREITLGPFHSAVSAAGWPTVGGQRHQENGVVPWPSQVKLPRLPDTVADGTTLVVGDTLYPEPLRDLVAYAHRVGRIL